MTNNYLPKNCIECGYAIGDDFDVFHCERLDYEQINDAANCILDNCPLKANEYNKYPVTPQPEPVINNNPAVWDLVMKDIVQRDHNRYLKYGTRLQPFNGRDAIIDAYQEALDLVVYLRQAIFERDGK